MQYRNFKTLGNDVSAIGFGAWAIGGFWGENKDNESLRALYAALDHGVNFIDTAHVYGDGHSETLIGKVLKERRFGGASGNQPAGPVYVATKVPPLSNGEWPPFPHERCEERYPEKHIREGVDLSLRRLGVETIDVLQLHTWTRAWNKNPTALDVLRKLKQEGKIRAVGISTPEPDQNSLVDLMRGGWLDSVQVIYNIFEQEPAAEFLEVAREHGVGVIVRCVLDEGALTGKFQRNTRFDADDWRSRYFKGERFDDLLKRVEAVKQDVGKHPDFAGDSLASVAVRFALNHPAVTTVITGIRTIAQAEMNTAMADMPPLSEALMRDLRKHLWRRYFWDAI